MTMEDKKELLLTALGAFMRQRPGLEFGNYGDRKAYFSEMRSITRDLHHARALLSKVAMSRRLTAEQLLAAFQAYSGRLTVTERSEGGFALNYCTGQYFPTEYRRAVCAVLAQALWDYWFEGAANGQAIRATAKRELGATIARRWFN